jgi:hypothetical protein
MRNWAQIHEFPNYEVSRTGEVRSIKTGRLIATSRTQQGAVKVGLIDYDNVQRTRTVKVLVAEAFVDGHNHIFNTPIHRDGNQENNHAENLCWRPRWFAWKWKREQADLASGDFEHYYHEPIFEVVQQKYYEHVAHAAMECGCLPWDIFKSANKLERVFPDGLQFRFVNDGRLGEIGTDQEYQYV